jgi:hypothetical protein
MIAEAKIKETFHFKKPLKKVFPFHGNYNTNTLANQYKIIE